MDRVVFMIDIGCIFVSHKFWMIGKSAIISLYSLTIKIFIFYFFLIIFSLRWTTGRIIIKIFNIKSFETKNLKFLVLFFFSIEPDIFSLIKHILIGLPNCARQIWLIFKLKLNKEWVQLHIERKILGKKTCTSMISNNKINSKKTNYY